MRLYTHSQLVIVLCGLNVVYAAYVNKKPVIGVLLQESTGIFNTTKSYVAASYVKFIESGGAQVVPIRLNRPLEYYKQLLSGLNGVLFPGGDVDIATSEYAKTGKLIYNYAVLRNHLRDYFPLWGTCDGFEMLSYLLADEKNILTSCDSNDQPLNLDFTGDARRSRLFGDMPTAIYNELLRKNITANYHSFCLTKENVTKFGLDERIRVLSVNRDSNGLEFISSFEAVDYPFYATQFHPEKSAYEWTVRPHHSQIPHSAEAVRAASYFAQFFVNQSRKSRHSFKGKFTPDLIYNYQPVRTDHTAHCSFEKTYCSHEERLERERYWKLLIWAALFKFIIMTIMFFSALFYFYSAKPSPVYTPPPFEYRDGLIVSDE